MGAAIIGTVAGYGDYSNEIKRFDAVCHTYDERYGTLPARRMEVSKLASELLGISLSEANRLFEGKSTDNRFIKDFQGRNVIIISRNHTSYEDAYDMCRSFTNLGIKSEVIGKPLEIYREELIESILK